METKIRRSKKIQFIIPVFILAVMQGCASAKKTHIGESTGVPAPMSQAKPAETMGPPEAFGPPPPEAPPSYGPEPIQVRPVVLVLGPGLARGFAYAGVIQSLKKAKIPIGAVLGTEMGALIGALYVMSNNVNQFEWGLLKFKEDIFLEKKGFLSKLSNGPSQGSKLESLLQQIFEKKDLAEAKIPVRVAIQSQDSGIPVVLNSGNVAQAIRAALASPELFTAANWSDNGNGNKIKAVSAATTLPFLVNEGKNLGIGPVIAISVLGKTESGVALDELKGADLVIRPDVKGIDFLDFQKKSDASFRGKNAIIQHISEIKHLVGMPEIE